MKFFSFRYEIHPFMYLYRLSHWYDLGFYGSLLFVLRNAEDWYPFFLRKCSNMIFAYIWINAAKKKSEFISVRVQIRLLVHSLLIKWFWNHSVGARHTYVFVLWPTGLLCLNSGNSHLQFLNIEHTTFPLKFDDIPVPNPNYKVIFSIKIRNNSIINVGIESTKLYILTKNLY